MKKKRIKIEELKVQSFITEMNKAEEKTVGGGLVLGGRSVGRDCTYIGPRCKESLDNIAGIK